MRVSSLVLIAALSATPMMAIAQDATTTAPAANSGAMAPADNSGGAMAPADNANGAMAPADNSNGAMAPADNSGAMSAGTTAAPGDAMAPNGDQAAPPPASMLASGYNTTDKDNLASEIIDQPVYSSTATDAENIGSINNLVIGDDGKVAAVIIGVGGFLGIGEKNVAINYSELQFTMAADNTERYVLPTTKEALQAAPDFTTTDNGNGAAPAAGMNATPMAPASGTDSTTMAPADNSGGAMAPANGAMAPATDGAMAPATDGTMAPATDSTSTMAPAAGTTN